MSLLKTAKSLEYFASDAARQAGLSVTVAVVDPHGNCVLLARMDDAVLASLDMAERKAFTAVALRMPTEDIAREDRKGGALHQIGAVGGGRYVSYGGGLPLWKGTELLGAIGVSGGTSKEDIEIASSAIESAGLKSSSLQCAGLTE